jgi:hypothetical protein
MNASDYLLFLEDASNFIKEQYEDRGSNDYLSREHSSESKSVKCFLEDHFKKNHLTMEVFRNFAVEPKHYLIKNWWFYLETTFPCLIKSLQKIRYLLEA